MAFYTNVLQHKGRMLLRGIDDYGNPFREKINYKPYLFINSRTDKESIYRTIHDEVVHRMDFDSIREAKDYIKAYSDVDGHTIYGMDQFVYPFIFDNFPGPVEYDPSKVSVVSLDIETKMGKGGIVEAVRTTPNEITAITITKKNKIISFGCKDFVPHQKNIKYFKCRDEEELLLKFLAVWNMPEISPDVVTGWYIDFFDIPYLVGRITKILGETKAKELSPWGLISAKEIEIKGQKTQSFTLEGISILDYMDLYKKFTYSVQESYSLGYITEVELGTTKLDYSEYENLDDMYEKDFQKYMEYNIHDAVLVLMLEEKMKLIELVFAIAYDARVNYSDAFTTVRLWDVIIHHYLLEQNIVIPPAERSISNDTIVGGFVKEPMVGMHKWVVSFDLNSLYPHLIQQYNISPDVFVKMTSVKSVDEIIAGWQIPEPNFSVTANGCMFRKDKQGFLAALSEKGYVDRSSYKEKMLEAEQEYEKTKDDSLKNTITRFDKLQHAKKIILNGLYGALANKYFRWYKLIFAEGITLSGQLSTKWVIKDINQYLNKLLQTQNKDYLVAGDTDSTYIVLDDLVKKFFPNETDDIRIARLVEKFCKQKLQKVIDDSFQRLCDHMHAYKQRMFMKLECIANKAIWVAKKRYILNTLYKEGVFYNEPKLKLSGIEAVRSSTPSVCRDAIKKSLSVIMNENEESLHIYIANFKDKFNRMTFEEIACPSGVSDVSKYTDFAGNFIKGTPIHVKGSILFNRIVKEKNLQDKYDTIGDGDKIKFSYLKKPNLYNSNVIAAPSELPKEFELDKFIDYDAQFERTYLQPITRILDTIGWSSEKKNSLESFFG